MVINTTNAGLGWAGVGGVVPGAGPPAVFEQDATRRAISGRTAGRETKVTLIWG